MSRARASPDGGSCFAARHKARRSFVHEPPPTLAPPAQVDDKPTGSPPACQIPLPLPTRPPARRLTSALALAVSLGALVAALVAPSQSLAKSHKPTCSTSASHAKTKRTVHACAQSSHKGKSNAHHAPKRHATHALTKATSPAPSSPAAAYCEDGSAPVRATDGSFSCDDGSQPECEGGSTPTPSINGTSLVCPVSSEGGSGEAECAEGPGSICSAGTSYGTSEQACETSSNSSNFVCERES